MKTIEGITLDWIYARVIDVDGCLIWNGSCGGGDKLPQARIGGKAMVMRRVMWTLANERAVPEGRRITMTCQNDKCIHPDHVRAAKVNFALRGVRKSLAHRAAIARSKRANSKWDEDAILAIKASDEPIKELAAANEMDPSYVHYIKRGQARRDFTNPFLQLERR